MKSIYVLSRCNDSKEISSFETLIVTTSKRKVIKEVKEQIELGFMTVSNNDLYENVIHSNIPSSLFAWELNSILKNGYIKAWND